MHQKAMINLHYRTYSRKKTHNYLVSMLRSPVPARDSSPSADQQRRTQTPPAHVPGQHPQLVMRALCCWVRALRAVQATRGGRGGGPAGGKCAVPPHRLCSLRMGMHLTPIHSEHKGLNCGCHSTALTQGQFPSHKNSCWAGWGTGEAGRGH